MYGIKKDRSYLRYDISMSWYTVLIWKCYISQKCAVVFGYKNARRKQFKTHSLTPCQLIPHVYQIFSQTHIPFLHFCPLAQHVYDVYGEYSQQSIPVGQGLEPQVSGWGGG